MTTTSDPRPQVTLARILDDLGTTLLHPVAGDIEHSGRIGGIAIYDPFDEPDLASGAVVLGIGIHDDDIVRIAELMGDRGAAALVLRSPVRLSAGLTDVVDRTGLAVLGLSRGASWSQLVGILRSLLAEGSVALGHDETADPYGLKSGDLFALANAISGLLDAPVTIEDRSSRLLAFSARQDEADEERVETILGRQVPERVTQSLVEHGIFRALYRDEKSIWIGPDVGLSRLPRVAIAVRAGDEVLGSIWAAVREPLSDARSEALAQAAKVVALHLLHMRASANVDRRMRTDLVATAIAGGPEALEALTQLGLRDKPLVVLALEVVDASAAEPSVGGMASLETERRRVDDAFALHLSAMDPRCASARLGTVSYALVPTSRHGVAGEERAVRIAKDFLDRLGRRAPTLIAVGSVAEHASELTSARITADRVLRVLRTAQRPGLRVARLADIHFDSVLLDLQDIAIAHGGPLSAAVARLAEYDAEHGGDLLQTFVVWLNSFGDVTSASEALGVHRNTLRYRITRISTVGQIDLADPDARLAAMLELRVGARSGYLDQSRSQRHPSVLRRDQDGKASS
ncbi:PucR family transcriptional regulator [Kribbella sp. NPDC051620]|uniref:PucR family transcriptional regulator n=1 Tax=Kribbella sp. NPDC051620 TaxID=3364120 RepID=UPI00379321A7